MHARIRSSLRMVLAAGFALGATTPSAQAQQAQSSAKALAPRTPPVDVSAPARPVGPTLEAATVAVKQPATETKLSSAAAPRRAGYGQPVALMVVGGAGLLAGLIIGGGAGTAIAVGGAVVGLYGLYEYLQ